MPKMDDKDLNAISDDDLEGVIGGIDYMPYAYSKVDTTINPSEGQVETFSRPFQEINR